MQSLERTLLNYPITVIFAGFESDTLTLQRNGWQFLVQQDYSSMSLNVVMKHSTQEMGMFHLRSNRIDYQMLHIFQTDPAKFFKELVLSVGCFAAHSEYRIFPTMGSVRFKPFDATPEMSNMEEAYNRHTETMYSQDVSKLFRSFDDSKELVVDPADVNQLMDMILKSQYGKQKEIIKREIRDREISLKDEPIKKLHLQLCSA